MKKINDKFQKALSERDLERLSRLRLMDDDFFIEVLNGKIVAVEFILNTILGRADLKVRHGSHIIYVNGSFQDIAHPIGRLMHDFHCQNADDMINPILAEEVRAMKETEGGQRHMCRLLEEMREEAAAEATHDKAVELALKMLQRGRDTCEEIAELTGISVDEILKLKALD